MKRDKTLGVETVMGATPARKIGGPGRDRTDDLFHAMEARSQLRHRPTLGGLTLRRVNSIVPDMGKIVKRKRLVTVKIQGRRGFRETAAAKAGIFYRSCRRPQGLLHPAWDAASLNGMRRTFL